MTKIGSGSLNSRYDTIEQFNVDLKAECDQLNLAHEMTKLISVYRILNYPVKYPYCQYGKRLKG